MSGHVVDRLSAFLDGELSEAERGEVQAHLESCGACRTRLSELAWVDESARGLEAAAPEGYFEALPGRVRSRLRPTRRASLPVWGWAAAAALLIAVLVPKLSHEPYAPKPEPAARVPAAPPPPSTSAERTLAPAPVASAVPKPSAPATAGRRDEPRPGAGPARDAAKTESARSPEQGFAAPPAATAVQEAPTPTPPEERVLAEAEEQRSRAADRSAPLAAGAVSKERRKQAFENKAQADAQEQERDALTLTSASRSLQEARSLRESWRERARRHREGPQADEARLQLVEAGARAYALGGDPRDREVLRQDAQAYLARRDARRPSRVRELLRSVEGAPQSGPASPQP